MSKTWSVEEHLEDILRSVRPLDPIELNLLDAQGCVWVDDVIVPAALPPFDNSSMDGYAVRTADVRGASEEFPAVLSVVGDIAAGSSGLPVVVSGEAARIMTGARAAARRGGRRPGRVDRRRHGRRPRGRHGRAQRRAGGRRGPGARAPSGRRPSACTGQGQRRRGGHRRAQGRHRSRGPRRSVCWRPSAAARWWCARAPGWSSSPPAANWSHRAKRWAPDRSTTPTASC